MTNKLHFNKGEWSEFYTILKLMSEQKLYAADDKLRKLEEIFYPILKIITAKGSEKEMSYEFDEKSDIKFLNPTTGTVVFVDRESIKNRIESVFEAIKSANVSTFEIPIAEEILDKLGRPSIKGYSTRKADVVLKIHDINTGYKPEVGFSIKSQIGGASTLLNPGETTNFIYEISGMSVKPEEINSIDTFSKVRDRLKAISKAGGKLSFVKVSSDIFTQNLIKIDSLLPALVSQMLIIYYSGVASKMRDIVSELESSGYNLVPEHVASSGFYEFKVKNFLMNTALGMTPGYPWDGTLEAHGGYIIVREDGEVVCYHIYNQDAFREYLFANTRLETASTGRYGFATVYEEGGRYYIKLNLQVRFID